MNHNRPANQSQNRSFTALWCVLLLAPLSMANKGCDSVVIGDNCPDEKPCTAGAPGSAGAAGSQPTAGAGTAGKPTGGGGSAGDVVCGGLQGKACAANEYCAFELKADCGSGDQTGVCKTKPENCALVDAPVCGCDGKTYSNECIAATKGTSVQHNGACEQQPNPGTSCGGLKPITCAKDEYCNFPLEAQCGAADQTGTCTKIPDACDAIEARVCGCDDVTYSSDCVAATKGVSVAHSGACETTPQPGATCGGLQGTACAKDQFCNFTIEAKCGSADQTGTCTTFPDACTKEIAQVCGCDNLTYANACEASRQGVSVVHTGPCDTPSGKACGGLLGISCAKGEYCNFPISTQCGSGDQMGSCAVMPLGCNFNLAPVCGCDGNTYSNSCAAAGAGVSEQKKGYCTVECGGNLGNTCNAGQYCKYPLSANCGSTDGRGVCEDKITGGCLANYDPVCGCDGKTYGNDCEAGRAGMSVLSQGACP